MIELIKEYLKEWTTKEVILDILKTNGVTMDERAFRKMVEIHNKQYQEHQVNEFLAHSRKGYKLTTNKDEIIASAKDYRKRALNQLMKYSKTLKAMGENDNFKLEIKDGSFVFIEGE